jgi:hypothetical protein
MITKNYLDKIFIAEDKHAERMKKKLEQQSRKIAYPW